MSKGKEGDGAESFEAGLFLNEEYALLDLDTPSFASLLLLLSYGNAILVLLLDTFTPALQL